MLRGDVAILDYENRFKLVTENGIQTVKIHDSETAKLLHVLSTTGASLDFDNEPEGSLLRKLRDTNLIHYAPADRMTTLQAMQWSWNEAIVPGRNITQRLQNSTVVIVGCGGTGSLVAQSLAGSGVGSFILIDFDKVTIDNLNRQFVFGSQDIGQYKSNVLAQRLKENQKVINARTVVMKVTSGKQLAKFAEGANLIICCADEPKGAIQGYIANAAVKTGASALYGSVGINNGILGPLLKNKHSLLAYLRWIKKVRRVCNKIIVPARFPSNGITNSIIANLIAWEAFQYLANIGPLKVEARILNVNLNSLEITKKQEFK